MPSAHWKGESEKHFRMRMNRDRYICFLRDELEKAEEQSVWNDKFIPNCIN